MSKKRKKISNHISYAEATKSVTAIKKNIDNTPDEDMLKIMGLTARKVFEPVRKHFSVPIGITSFYRSPALNKALKGSKTSSHMKGEAIDMDADMFGLITNSDIFHYIKDNLQFDQLIWEFGDDKEPDWIHVSYSATNNRCEILVAYKTKNRWGKTVTRYKHYEA